MEKHQRVTAAEASQSEAVTARKAGLRSIEVKGVKILLEKRMCAVPGCERHFWPEVGSPQSICSITCWEWANEEIWKRGLAQPDVRRPGEESKPLKKPKKKANEFRKRQDADWCLRIARLKYVSKHGEDPLARLQEQLSY